MTTLAQIAQNKTQQARAAFIDAAWAGQTPDRLAELASDAGIEPAAADAITHSAGQYLSIETNAAGQPVTITDSAGRFTTFTYDSTETYLLAATGPDGITTSYTYQTEGPAETDGALLSITTAGVSQFFSYDARGRLATTSQNGGANLIRYTYDNTGRINIADNLGTTSLFYDAHGLLSRTEDPFGNFTTALYGDDYRISTIIDPLGQAQHFTWCSCGSLTSSTDQLGHTTLFEYEWIGAAHGKGDTIRRMTSFTDANGNITRYTYDSNGNRTSTIYADGSVEYTSEYDDAGSPTEFINRRGQVLSYQYNAAGQVTRQTFDDGSFITLGYDDRGNLTTITEPGSRITTYAYDGADRLTRVTYPEGRYLDYTYDVAGRRESMTDQTGYRTNYFHDALGRLSRMTDTDDMEIVRYTYDAGGRLLRTDKGNGTYTTNTYDAAGQITNLVNYAPSGSINSRFDYTYDVLGRRTSQDTIDGRWVYGYDSSGQLTSAVFTPVPGSSLPVQNLQYVYDAVGNRKRTVENGATRVYGTNVLNQYVSAGDQLLLYDASGNLTSIVGGSEASSYIYDQQNRIVSVVVDSVVSATYEYDAIGNRRARNADGIRTEFTIDPAGGMRVVGDVVDGVSESRYTFGLSLVEERGSKISASYYFEHDAYGSNVGITSHDGTSIATYSYDPFGRNAQSLEVDSNRFMFLGGYGVASEHSGLMLTDNRAYRSSEGRFVSIDPIGLAGGDTNLYGFSLNGPINLVDPSGLAAVPANLSAFGQAYGAIKRLFDSGKLGMTDLGECDARVVGLWGTSAGILGGIVGRAGFSYALGFVGMFVAGPVGVVIGGAIGNFVGGLVGGLVGGAGGIEIGKQAVDAICPPTPPPPLPPPPVPPLPPPPAPPWAPPWAPDVTVPQAADPNDILGPDGVGAERWISAANPISYTIRFENDPLLANAPAQFVRITQMLDSDLDPRSFRIGTFGFSGMLFEVPENRAYYAVRLDLRDVYGIFVDVVAAVDVAGGSIFWEFTSIDPLTGERPVDRFIGFLPPNITRPEGDGFVSYSVRAKTTVPTGSRVDAMATIIFNENAPIDTPPIFNTLDVSGPTSAVSGLPSASDDPRFRVRWSGGDGEIGSGLSTYDVFVSRDNGPFEIWLNDTTMTEAEFAGELGSKYAFYSVAIDNVGNAEAPPLTPDAVIIVGGALPMLTSFVVNDGASQRSMVKSLTVTFSRAVTFTSGAFTVRGHNSTVGTLISPIGADGLSFRVTFIGQGLIGGSIGDGRFMLTLDGSRFSDSLGRPLAATTTNRAFHRLFGDLDGDADVDTLDLARFHPALGTTSGNPNYRWFMDYESDGDVDQVDWGQVRSRLGKKLGPQWLLPIEPV